ncbi:unnamed protein product [Cryptosporidium hominis]|uniref:SUN domain-containing protein n=1 Tax=Cryptosporidium hominis TaxID=237895 RepID=A0A0S4TMQ1_CRYHO|nr:hypothetical protein ChTU502y2012_400fg0290 [Cryptosporidium hominis]PPA63760.1 Sad1 / UNC-like C-terminal family protein [Cryptosporidium hominis]CUV08037.1 unnamed protein product [Cryptosporidium hominis]
MIKCKVFPIFLVIFGIFYTITLCSTIQYIGYCENHEFHEIYVRVIEKLYNKNEEITRRDKRNENIKQIIIGKKYVNVLDSINNRKEIQKQPNLEYLEDENSIYKTYSQRRSYFTNLNPADCRINILRRHKIKISRVSVSVMESFDRLIQLVDILSSRKPCPYCKGCNDSRLDSLPIWVSPILHRQIKRVNSQLDNKLCLILKKDSKLNSIIREIIFSIKDKKLTNFDGITSNYITSLSSLVARTKLRRKENFPLYLLGGIFELMLDDLRKVGIKISSCHPSQFLFKCSWHPIKQNLEISAKLKAVSKSMLNIYKSLELESDSTTSSNSDKSFKLSFKRKISGEYYEPFKISKEQSNNFEESILNKDIIKIPTSSGSHSSCISTTIGTSVGSNLSSTLGSSHISPQNKCIPPFLDSMIMLKHDGSPNPDLHICGSLETIKHKNTRLEEKEEVEIKVSREDKMYEKSKLKVIQGAPYVSQLAALHYDYASSSSNSKVLSWSEGVLRPKSVQSSNPDSYLLVPCNKPMWFVIGFQEDIFLEYIALFSLEYFSSSFREIEISGSLIYPTKQWIPIGILRRNQILPKEMFDLKTLCVKHDEGNHLFDHLVYNIDDHDHIHTSPKGSRVSDIKEDNTLSKTSDKIDHRNSRDQSVSGIRKDSIVSGGHIKENNLVHGSNPCWVRYIRVRAISYYEEGHYYCHLNRIQIFGNNVINRLEVEMGGGDRRSSISMSEMEESVKDVENRLWKRDIERDIHETINDQKPQIMYFNSSNFSTGTNNKKRKDDDILGAFEVKRSESRSLLIKNQEKDKYIDKREIFQDHLESINGRYFTNSKSHPLLSLIDRVKILEKQLDTVKLERRAILADFNSSFDDINDSIYRLSNSVKFLQDILLGSNMNNTENEQNDTDQIKFLKLGDIYLIQSLNLVGSYLERFLGKYYSGEAITYLTQLFESIRLSILNLFGYFYNHFQTLIIALLFTTLFISQIILFKKYISLKRRLHNTLQFFKSYSQSNNASPKNSILLDENLFFQKNLNLKLHSNPVTNTYRFSNNQSNSNTISASNSNINSNLNINDGNNISVGDITLGNYTPSTIKNNNNSNLTFESNSVVFQGNETAFVSQTSVENSHKDSEICKIDNTKPQNITTHKQEAKEDFPDISDTIGRHE